MLDSIYHMTNTLKSDFWRKIVVILSLCTQRCYGCHNVSRKSINHQWFTDFIEWRYFTPRRHMIKHSIYSSPKISRMRKQIQRIYTNEWYL